MVLYLVCRTTHLLLDNISSTGQKLSAGQYLVYTGQNLVYRTTIVCWTTSRLPDSISTTAQYLVCSKNFILYVQKECFKTLVNFLSYKCCIFDALVSKDSVQNKRLEGLSSKQKARRTQVHKKKGSKDSVQNKRLEGLRSNNRPYVNPNIKLTRSRFIGFGANQRPMYWSAIYFCIFYRSQHIGAKNDKREIIHHWHSHVILCMM